LPKYIVPYEDAAQLEHELNQCKRELEDARERATTAWSDNLILDSRNRQLERELSEAREEIEMLQIRSAAASMHHAHNMDELRQQRDTLMEALDLSLSILIALMDGNEDVYDLMVTTTNKNTGEENKMSVREALEKSIAALAAVKGGSDE
jgi:regulator of replication initiation timing